jgi:hypothetical protein
MKTIARIAPLFLIVTLAGCFEFEKPPCTYSCGDGKKCPDDYACMADGYCHLKGAKMTACVFSDAATAGDQANGGAAEMSLADANMSIDMSMPGEDMSMPGEDMSMPIDLSMPDIAMQSDMASVMPDMAAAVDAAMAVDAAQQQDMAVQGDMAQQQDLLNVDLLDTDALDM